jgi:hypothetical protein
LQRYAEAQALNQEGLRIAEEVGRKEYILQGSILSAKVDFTLGNKDALHRLKNMLQQTDDNAEIAILHYELWKMAFSEEHRQAALDLYKTLYAATPNIDYKRRMEEMKNYKG